MDKNKPDVLVIGAGPAGLMAAETAASLGRKVLLADAMPSFGRKLLMAGKTGLNLTMEQPESTFINAYSPPAFLAPMLQEFGVAEVQNWTRGLNQPLFTGSSGRVFPVAMKASPILRAWLARLAGLGVEFRTRWRWTGLENKAFSFETPQGPLRVIPGATVLALGGASWARLGSNGAWAEILAKAGVEITPFQPSNMGFCRAWSSYMQPHFGTPIKPVGLRAGAIHGRGEFVISRQGIEGGGIYPLAAALRKTGELELDLVPDIPLVRVIEKLEQRRKGDSLANGLRKSLNLGAAKLALLQEAARPLPNDSAALARLLKALPLVLDGPYPMDQAISTTGGIARDAVDDSLQLHKLAGVFVAGEMLDWDAPTGGYLLTACLATGRWAGRAALDS
ncbi:MAG: TIGR03862 family flavoprotein [Paracoccaceae bacterium]